MSEFMCAFLHPRSCRQFPPLASHFLSTCHLTLPDFKELCSDLTTLLKWVISWLVRHLFVVESNLTFCRSSTCNSNSTLRRTFCCVFIKAQQQKTTGAGGPINPEASARARYELSLKVKGHLIKAVLWELFSAGSGVPPFFFPAPGYNYWPRREGAAECLFIYWCSARGFVARPGARKSRPSVCRAWSLARGALSAWSLTRFHPRIFRSQRATKGFRIRVPLPRPPHLPAEGCSSRLPRQSHLAPLCSPLWSDWVSLSRP